MYVDKGRVNQLYPQLVHELLNNGAEVGPRGTQTLEISPAVLEIEDPQQRFVSSWGRPLNIAFALAEVLWILRGRRDVEMLAFYNESIRQFSDDGTNFNAPYGYRLRQAHGFDQLWDVECTLSSDRDSRQGTLTIWHPNDRGWYHDPELTTIMTRRNTRDRACNLTSHMMIRDDKLNWLQLVRSNDVILGVPYNFIQWTLLQEYMAQRLQVGVGKFTYIADSMHLYVDGGYYPKDEAQNITEFDLYHMLPDGPLPATVPLIGHTDEELEAAEAWEEAVRKESKHPVPHDLDPFWDMACWVFAAHREYRNHNDADALEMLLENVPPLLAVLQIKFYARKRWWRPAYDMLRVQEQVEDRFGSAIAMWLTDMAHVPN